MCGFLITNFKNIKNQNKILHHRGPDNFRSFSIDGINFNFNRLKIVDLNNRSNQPFIYDKYILVYNGEIYNYLEIKEKLKKLNYKFKTSSDTEVLLFSYIQWGKKCLKMFEGMFSFCIYDKSKKEFFIARDAFGIKPLFYYFNQKQFIISSEIKNILAYDVKKIINKDSLYKFLNYGVYQDDSNTFYKDIFSLTPGHYAVVKNNKIYSHNWYNLKEINIQKNSTDINEEIKYLLNKSIKLSFRSDKEVALALSSGVDSYYIYQDQKENNFENISSFYHWSCKDENSEEKILIKEIKNSKLNINYFNKNDFFKYFKKSIKIINGPVGGLNFLSALKAFENIKKNKVRVLIDGTGADEILGGYKHYIDSHYNNLRERNAHYVQGLKIDFYPEIFNEKFFKNDIKFNYKKDLNNHTSSLMYRDLMGSKIRRSLSQVDHLTMANSIEGRFPYLNHELINYCFSIPRKLLFKKNIGKLPLRKLIKNQKIAFSPKNSLQTPQIKWMHEFIYDKFYKDLSKDENFFSLNILKKDKTLEALCHWKKNVKNNSVFPWYLMNSYYLIKQIYD
jgi:asparagine synthase (glutamine-hydrolysing)